MSDCLFCNISTGELPATIVKKSDRHLAFRDINPQAPTHILAIPREHIRSLNEADDTDVLGRLMSFVREVAAAEGLSTKGYRVVFNTNSDGGQTVYHIHAHILGGRPMKWPPG